MATKISINIDLTQSNRAHPHEELTPKQKSLSAPLEYKYRYDRIFLFTVIFFIIVTLSLYFIFSEKKPVVQKTPKISPAHDIIIKEKHPTLASPVLKKPHQHLVYLYYKETNVLESFQFPLKNPTPAPEKPNITEEISESTKSPSEEKAVVERGVEKEVEEVEEVEEVKEVEIKLKIEPPIPPTIINPPETIKGVNDSTEKPDFIQIHSKDLNRVLLVSDINKKEPANELSYIVTGRKDSAKKTYLFTQIDNRVGQSIEHQWWYKGKIRHKIKFSILGKRWRCYSSKNIGKLQQGKWQVKVVDETGEVLSTVNFKYQVN